MSGVIGTERIVIAVPFTVSLKPESKPLMVMLLSCAGVQGDANIDCVTVWFPKVTFACGKRLIRKGMRRGRNREGKRTVKDDDIVQLCEYLRGVEDSRRIRGGVMPHSDNDLLCVDSIDRRQLGKVSAT